MSDIFLSHAEEDGQEVIDLAKALEETGYSTWYYERDATAGLSYLKQIGEAIKDCQVLLLMISKSSLKSHQVDIELTHAFEKAKKLLPLLKDVTFVDLERLKPDWKLALGPLVAEQLSVYGVDINKHVERVVLDLNRMGVLGTHDRDTWATPKTVLVRIRLGPEDLILKIRSKDLRCSYQLFLDGEEQPWQAATVVHDVGGYSSSFGKLPLTL